MVPTPRRHRQTAAMTAKTKELLSDIADFRDFKFAVEAAANNRAKLSVAEGAKPTFTCRTTCSHTSAARAMRSTSLIAGMQSIRIKRQPVEYAVSDKYHAAWKHGDGNTGLRDYYDLYVFFTNCKLDDARLREAFQRSWPMYGDEVPASLEEIEAYGDAWAQVHEAEWAALKLKSTWAVDAPSLTEVCELIRGRLGPVLDAASLRPRAA